ncbi:MAG: type I secretion system permease/ATPase [Chloroflexota bacterium]|nr:type I secretion system permease/ATPase [Chloroflexota bacterium]
MTGAGGGPEIRAALSESRRLFVSVGLFSVFVNLLMLTGPLFMLQVYDRVLTSRSEATLAALVAIVAFLFLAMGLLDHARARVLARAGARFQARMDARVTGAILDRAGRSPEARSSPATGLHDLEAMQRFASGPGPFAFFDAPWTPAFLFVLFTFHWLLGVLAALSGVLLVALALLNSARTAKLQAAAGGAAARAGHFVEQLRAGGETVRGLGMRGPATARAGALRTEALRHAMAASDRGGAYAAASRTLRLFLQSMMLGLGAWLAIRGEVTAGIMIAASILLGRALAPIDQAVAQWPVLQRALQGRRALAALLRETPEAPGRTPLPAPEALLEAEGLVVAAPGAALPAVRGVTFRLKPGHAVGIAGPSASGKSTLARALAGVWPPAAGAVRLGGAALDQYGEAVLARHLGWLPQDVLLFEGTVAGNIARLDPAPDAGAVVAAATRAGAHEMILALPGGYDFQVAAGGAALSGGQRQRIALARAFFGDPAVVVLDEPDAHLDAAGAAALVRAVAAHKARGGAAVIVAHRPAAFAGCDLVLLMENGRTRPVADRPGPPGEAADPAGGTTEEVEVRRVAGPPGLREGEAAVRLVGTGPPEGGEGDPA